MNRYRTSVFLMLGALWSGGMAAQEMGLRDCMEYAVTHSSEMRLSAADRSDERAAHRQALLAAFTPSVDAQSYAYNHYGCNVEC